jgi:cytidylate kinase
MEYIQIAVDGPAGSGKTSIMQEVAKRLNYDFIDTGLTYRAFTKFLLAEKVDFNNGKAIEEALSRFNCQYINEEIYVNGENYMAYVTGKDVMENINKITTLKVVRDFMVNLQREVATSLNCVLTGRDITTVVLPNAKYKIYLDCSVEARAKRRTMQNIKNHVEPTDYDTIFEMIKTRDESDKHREVGPLKIAHDAIVVDNSTTTFEEAVENILAIVKEK